MRSEQWRPLRIDELDDATHQPNSADRWTNRDVKRDSLARRLRQELDEHLRSLRPRSLDDVRIVSEPADVGDVASHY
jgi:hypothetical protein